MKYNMLAREIRVLGRTVQGEAVPVFWTGSGLETIFEGRDLYLEYVSNYAVYEDWIRVEMNGATVIRMPLEKGHHEICLLRHIREDANCLVRIIKEVQPMEDDPDRYLVFCSLRTEGRLHRPAEHRMKIEFVGDSLTAGQGLSGPVGYIDWTSISFSTENHYAFAAAQMLDAEIQILAQGGWGVATAWNNDVHAIMPRVYEQVCSVAEGPEVKALGALKEQDFTQWKADYVIVNLGTNDANAFHQPAWKGKDGKSYQMLLDSDGKYTGPSAEKVIEACRCFLKQIREKRPESYLIWVYGMCGDEIGSLLREGVERYKKASGDSRAEYLALAPARGDEMGSNDHPGAKCHLNAARTIVDEICILQAEANRK